MSQQFTRSPRKLPQDTKWFWYDIFACHTAHTQSPSLSCLSELEALDFCTRKPNIEPVDARSHVGAVSRMTHMPTCDFPCPSQNLCEILCSPFCRFCSTSSSHFVFGWSFSSCLLLHPHFLFFRPGTLLAPILCLITWSSLNSVSTAALKLQLF